MPLDALAFAPPFELAVAVALDEALPPLLVPPHRTVADAVDGACDGCCCCNGCCCCDAELAVRAAARAELIKSRDPVTAALGSLLLL